MGKKEKVKKSEDFNKKNDINSSTMSAKDRIKKNSKIDVGLRSNQLLRKTSILSPEYSPIIESPDIDTPSPSPFQPVVSNQEIPKIDVKSPKTPKYRPFGGDTTPKSILS